MLEIFIRGIKSTAFVFQHRAKTSTIKEKLGTPPNKKEKEKNRKKSHKRSPPRLNLETTFKKIPDILG